MPEDLHQTISDFLAYYGVNFNLGCPHIKREGDRWRLIADRRQPPGGRHCIFRVDRLKQELVIVPEGEHARHLDKLAAMIEENSGIPTRVVS